MRKEYSGRWVSASWVLYRLENKEIKVSIIQSRGAKQNSNSEVKKIEMRMIYRVLSLKEFSVKVYNLKLR